MNIFWKIADDLLNSNKEPKVVFNHDIMDIMPSRFKNFNDNSRTTKINLEDIQISLEDAPTVQVNPKTTVNSKTIVYTFEEYILDLCTFEDFKITASDFHQIDSMTNMDLSRPLGYKKIDAIMAALICALATERKALVETLKKQLMLDCNVSPDCIKRSIEKILKTKGPEIQEAFTAYRAQKEVIKEVMSTFSFYRDDLSL